MGKTGQKLKFIDSEKLEFSKANQRKINIINLRNVNKCGSQ